MTPATEVGYVEMRIAKAVGLAADDELFDYVVLEEVAGDRHLVIEIGQPEAFSLAARLGGITWPRPMTYQFARPSDALNLAVLVQAPIFVAPEVLQEGEGRRTGDSPGAARLRRALVAPPMTIESVGR